MSRLTVRSMDAQTLASIGSGCLVLFSAPFILAGVLMVMGALTLVLGGRPVDGALLGAFGTVFGGVGVAVLVLGRGHARRIAERAELQAAHPEEPWRWRSDWASGRIQDEARGQTRVIWAFAGFWNLVAIPGGAMAVYGAMTSGDLLPLLGLVFPAVGLLLLWAALRASIRHRKYGTTELTLDAVPVPVGGTLDAAVRLPPGLTGLELETRLTCLSRVTTGSGKNRSTREEVRWEDRGRIALSGRGGDEVRIRFPIPADAPGWDQEATPAVIWRLHLSADVPGVDYHASFEVPVVRTTARAPETGEEARTDDEDLEPNGWSAESEVDPTAYRRPADSPITVETTRRGTEIYFPPGRNRGALLVLSVITVVWVGMVGLMFTLGAGSFIVGLFGAVGLFLLLGLGRMRYRWTRVLADRSALVLQRGPLGGRLEMRAGDVEEISVEGGIRTGSTAYYDIYAKTADGGLHPLGSGVADRREAEWLAAAILSALRG